MIELAKRCFAIAPEFRRKDIESEISGKPPITHIELEMFYSRSRDGIGFKCSGGIYPGNITGNYLFSYKELEEIMKFYETIDLDKVLELAWERLTTTHFFIGSGK